MVNLKAFSWISNCWIGLDLHAGLLGLNWINMPILRRLEFQHPVAISSDVLVYSLLYIQEDSEDHSLLDVNVRAIECSRDETRYVLWILYLAGSTFIPIVFQLAKWNTFGVLGSKILFGINEINSIRG
jgi:hypothetical protein